MSGDYWLGVATPFAVAAALASALYVFARVVAWFHARGWFMETGPPPKPEVNFHSRIEVRGRWGFYLGLYRTTAGWGSRWLALGPVTVGRRSEALALTEKPPPEERFRARAA